MSKHTPAPWAAFETETGQMRVLGSRNLIVAACDVMEPFCEEQRANAHLIAASPKMLDEMKRYLPILERLEADPEQWAEKTAGTGIATLNGYREAIKKAEEGQG